MGKINKGIFFSIVSLFIIVIFITISSLISDFQVGESEIEVTRTRVRLLNSVVSDFENVYFSKLLYISSKNALSGLTKYYYYHDWDDSYFVYDLWYALNASITNGIYPGSPPVDFTAEGCGPTGNDPCLDSRYTVNGLIAETSVVLDNIGITVDTISIEVTNVSQVDPWHLKVRADITYFFQDQDNIASWKGTDTKEVDVSVYGLYMPYNYTYYDIIDSSWMVETKEISNTPYTTESSVIDKLNNIKGDDTLGLGICKAGCYIK